MLVPVLVLVLQRGCLSPLCIFFCARCCKWIRNVTQTTRQRVKRGRGRAGAGGRVRRQQSRKSKRRTKKESHQNRTTHREQTKRTQLCTEQRRKNNAKVWGQNSKPEDSTRACPAIGLTQLCVIFGQHSSSRSRSLRTQLSTHSPPPQPRKSGLALWWFSCFAALSVSLCAFWDYARIFDDATPAIGRTEYWVLGTGLQLPSPSPVHQCEHGQGNQWISHISIWSQLLFLFLIVMNYALIPLWTSMWMCLVASHGGSEGAADWGATLFLHSLATGTAANVLCL